MTDEYSEGVLCDGAAILRNGEIMPISEIVAELNKSAWIPVEERLPDSTGEWLAVRWEPDHYPEIGIYLYDEDATYPGGEWPYGSFITHWMPLPEPPKGD